MQRMVESKRVPFSAQQMYDLVAGVEHYGEFLPWCSASTLLSRSETSQTAEITGPIFREVNRAMVEAFVQRARTLYG